MASVIGVVGPIGSGKDTVSDYIAKKYGYTIVSYRDIVREETEKAGMEPTRENLQKIGGGYREKYGDDYFAKKVMEKAKHLEKVVLKDMRRSSDVSVPKQYFKSEMIIILVEANEKTRLERMKERSRLSDPHTMEELRKQETREKELHFTDSFSMADVKIENKGSLEDLYRKIDQIMKDKMGYDTGKK